MQTSTNDIVAASDAQAVFFPCLGPILTPVTEAVVHARSDPARPPRVWIVAVMVTLRRCGYRASRPAADGLITLVPARSISPGRVDGQDLARTPLRA
jgi:hypothetical protein